MHGIVEIDAKVGGDTFINIKKMTDLTDKSRVWWVWCRGGIRVITKTAQSRARCASYQHFVRHFVN